MPRVQPLRSRMDVERFRAELARGRCGQRDTALFTIGINTAFRISDLLAMDVKDVRESSGRIRDSVTLRETKTRKRRAVPLNASARRTLEDWLAARPGAAPGEPLFPTTLKRGGRMSRRTVHKRYAAAAAALGLDAIGTHTLRKTFGLFLYEASGREAALVQKALRHSSPATTLAYIGLTDGMVDDAVRQLNL
ncbi:MAG: tyrosine-type recombinase/integrase [Deltaproteobacteria bacterium]|jgi:integrase|nr:tyrosine-type recombinase/integrase [Deltaproteobacteria bacterium]